MINCIESCELNEWTERGNIMEGKTSSKNILKFAGAYVACAIGSGFATGQEILQFFTAHGTLSIAGSFITMVLFSLLGGNVMKHARELELEVPGHIVKYYFGNTFGKIFEIVFQAFLYAIFVIMIAGAGATLAEYYGIHPLVGRIGMAAIAFLSVTLSLTKLTDILGSMGTLIVIFAIIVGLVSFLKNMDGFSNANEVVSSLEMTKSGGNWFFASILYPGFNIIAVLVFSAGVGSTANNKQEAFYGGLLGGILFGLAILCMNFGLLSQVGSIFDKEVPSLVLADQIGRVIGIVFSVILICGIYTTAVPMLWSVSSQFAKEKTKKFTVAALILTVVALVLGMTDFSKLVNIIYPFSGYVGIILMLLIFYRAIVNKQKEKS